MVASAEVSISEFSPEERVLLLRVAHESIACALQGREVGLDPPTAHLAEPRGAFTSLYTRKDIPGEARQREELRGCVGYVLPSCSVYRAVAETARAAAFEDSRFAPVTAEESPHLEVELSILSPVQLIEPGDVEIGRHGLLITWRGRRGLLLPQVPVEHDWDRTTFLEHTCRKAGLPVDAWQKGATVEAFTADVFGEKSSGQWPEASKNASS
jgi:AmmeMemoRadiSam system protein A